MTTNSLTDRPCVIPGLYSDRVDGHTLYYNPLGRGGLVVVDPASDRLLSLCCGTRGVRTLISEDGRAEGEVLAEIAEFRQRELLAPAPGEDSPEWPRPEPRLSCWVHVTNSCNLACPYCYVHRSPGTMPMETFRTLLDALLSSCGKHGLRRLKLIFAGGEPLTAFGRMQEMVLLAEERCEAAGVVLMPCLPTNATLADPGRAAWLAEHGFSVGVSLDGLGVTHDRTRSYAITGSSSFGDVVAGIEALRTAGIQPNVMVTLSRENRRQLPELARWLCSTGLSFRFSVERDVLSARPGLLSELEELRTDLAATYASLEASPPEGDFLRQHLFCDALLNRPVHASCSAGKTFLACGHDGALGVCGSTLAAPWGKLGEQQGDLVDALRAANPELVAHDSWTVPECRECPWRSSCAGGCSKQLLAAGGGVQSPSIYCSLYKEVLPRILRIRARQLIREQQRASGSVALPAAPTEGKEASR